MTKHLLQRFYPLVFLLGFLTMLTPFSIDMYLPAMPSIAQTFQTSDTSVQWTSSIYLLTFAFGQLFWGPLSDQYGRKKTLIIGLFFFVLTTGYCYFSQSINEMLFSRALQGLFGACTGIIAQSVIRDLFEKDDFARVMSWIFLVMTIAPLIAPKLGGYIAYWVNWQSIFLFIAVLALLALILVTLFLKETNKNIKKEPFVLGNVWKVYKSLLTNPTAMAYVCASALTFAGLLCFVTTSSFVYFNYYDVSSTAFGNYFAANVIALMLMVFVNGKLIRCFGSYKSLKICILVQCVAALYMLTCLALSAPLIIFTVGMMFYCGVIGVIGSNASACLLEKYKSTSGTAGAMLGVSRFGLGALISMTLSFFSSETPWPMVCVMFVASTTAFFIIKFGTSESDS